MLDIRHFFKRIQNVQAREMLVRTSIATAVEKHTGIQPAPENIHVKNSVATIDNLSQAERSALYIKKPAILRDLAQKDLPQVIIEVR